MVFRTLSYGRGDWTRTSDHTTPSRAFYQLNYAPIEEIIRYTDRIMNNHDQEIQALIDRNKRVEAGKAWETSWVRRILIAIVTYVAACIFLTVTGADHTRAWCSSGRSYASQAATT